MNPKPLLTTVRIVLVLVVGALAGAGVLLVSCLGPQQSLEAMTDDEFELLCQSVESDAQLGVTYAIREHGVDPEQLMLFASALSTAPLDGDVWANANAEVQLEALVLKSLASKIRLAIGNAGGWPAGPRATILQSRIASAIGMAAVKSQRFGIQPAAKDQR